MNPICFYFVSGLTVLIHWVLSDILDGLVFKRLEMISVWVIVFLHYTVYGFPFLFPTLCIFMWGFLNHVIFFHYHIQMLLSVIDLIVLLILVGFGKFRLWLGKIKNNLKIIDTVIGLNALILMDRLNTCIILFKANCFFTSIPIVVLRRQIFKFYLSFHLLVDRLELKIWIGRPITALRGWIRRR